MFEILGGMVPGEAVFVPSVLPVLLSEKGWALRESSAEAVRADRLPADVFFAALGGGYAGGHSLADVSILEQAVTFPL
jgi:hypothetical protein